MNADSISKLKDIFGAKISGIWHKSAKRSYIAVEKENLVEIAKYMFKDLGARFITASGIDTAGGFEILYHFDMGHLNKVATIRVLISDKKKPQVPSIANIIKGASWIEREIHELLGIDFVGHPNLKRLLLDDDWPKDNYPLRKS